jgi:hypothetical protein
MRPWMTIALALIVAAVIFYLRWQPALRHPREGDFVDCFADLTLLGAETDTTDSRFFVARDSVLTLYGFTDSTMVQLKSELDHDPQRLIEVWDRIEARVKQRRIEMGQKIDESKE